MDIRVLDKSSLGDCERIYADAREFMRECGNGGQWGSAYPPREQIESDIDSGKLYGIFDGEPLVGVFYFSVETDPSYAKIYDGEWIDNGEYGVIHRVAVSRCARGRGVARACFDYCKGLCASLRIDTHESNIPMQSALAKAGFTRCGRIMLVRGGERIAYQWSEEKNKGLSF